MKFEKTALRLREALSNKNMRPQDLANASGVNKASISQYLNGSHAPSNISSGKMAKVLGVSAPWLMGYDIDTPAASSAAVPDLRAYSEKEKKFIDVYLGLSQEDKDFLEKMMFRMVPEKEIGDDELMP